MNPEKFTYLIYQQTQGTLSPEDASRLNSWLQESAENVKIKDEIESYLSSVDNYKPTFNIDLDKEYAILRQKMDKIEIAKPKSRLKTYALGVLALLTLGAAIFYFSQSNRSVVTKTFKTLPGEIESLQLADGSMVWLNGNSTLNYTETFESDTRTVQLEGEAFFDIAKNPKMPFIVEMPYGNVEVLGTSFNINTRSNKSTTVSVASGQVRFSSSDNQSQIELNPKEQGVLRHIDNNLTKSSVNDLNMMSWQSQKLSFKNEPLTNVFKVLEKQFNIVIDCKNPRLSACKFSMTERQANLKNILASLEKFYKVTVVKKDDKSYVISEGECNVIQ